MKASNNFNMDPTLSGNERSKRKQKNPKEDTGGKFSKMLSIDFKNANDKTTKKISLDISKLKSFQGPKISLCLPEHKDEKAVEEKAVEEKSDDSSRENETETSTEYGIAEINNEYYQSL